MPISLTVARAREAYQREAWAEAFQLLSVIAQDAILDIEDLERLAISAYLAGRDEESADAWARAHQACLEQGDIERAARTAFWLAFGLFNRGDAARGGGWLARAHRLLEEYGRDCAERGYLLVPAGIERFEAGDLDAAYELFERAAGIGARFNDRELTTLARTGQGRIRIRQGQVGAGLRLLDEVMISVTAGDVFPVLVGAAYCSVMDAFYEVFDLRRAQQWTAALSEWCAAQPGLVPYRGECMVYRVEIMQLHGDWDDAADEAQRACEWLSRPPGLAAGRAFYQRGELYRLRGEFARSEEAYRQASRCGVTPQPGLALLRLAQGRLDAAVSAIRRAVEEAQHQPARANTLSACVDIMLAAGDAAAARAAAVELEAIAAEIDAPFLWATAVYAKGAVLLADGDGRSAVSELRRAWSGWQELEAPLYAARTRVLIGRAYRELGDSDTAAMEFDAARWAFRQLGAVPDAIQVEALIREADPAAATGLTAREFEVLRLVAAGKTNRAIAAELFISERTVDRHVSNIFAKLGVSSRAAASALAVKHELL